MREFDTDTLRVITAFENMTGVEVRDCLKNDAIYFLVGEGKIALAIGKGGQTIKNVESQIKKQVKVFEWNENPEIFVRNMIPKAQKIEIKEGKVSVTLGSKDRGAVIGKEGCNVKAIRELLERNSNIKDLKIL